MGFFLSSSSYTPSAALQWGFCLGHFERAQDQTGSLLGRTVHFLTACIEFIPILGQIVSLFEMWVWRVCRHFLELVE